MLEIYHKFNSKIPDQRELHGNVILKAKLADLDRVEMGFLFSPDPDSGNFDGLMVRENYEARSDFSPVFKASDLWTTSRPFTDSNTVNISELTKDNANDWNITGEKSKFFCEPVGWCTVQAHFNRKFTTNDK